MYKILMFGTLLGLGFGVFKMIKNKKQSENTTESPQPAQ